VLTGFAGRSVRGWFGVLCPDRKRFGLELIELRQNPGETEIASQDFLRRDEYDISG